MYPCTYIWIHTYPPLYIHMHVYVYVCVLHVMASAQKGQKGEESMFARARARIPHTHTPGFMTSRSKEGNVGCKYLKTSHCCLIGM